MVECFVKSALNPGFNLQHHITGCRAQACNSALKGGNRKARSSRQAAIKLEASWGYMKPCCMCDRESGRGEDSEEGESNKGLFMVTRNDSMFVCLE